MVRAYIHDIDYEEFKRALEEDDLSISRMLRRAIKLYIKEYKLSKELINDTTPKSSPRRRPN